MLRPLIEGFLRQQPGIDTAKLADPSVRVQDLGIDSLGMIEMLFEVEDKYGFHVEDPMRYGQMTLDELIADLEATIKAKHGGEIPATLGPSAKVDA
jgi:acyl carrier protein